MTSTTGSRPRAAIWLVALLGVALVGFGVVLVGVFVTRGDYPAEETLGQVSGPVTNIDAITRDDDVQSYYLQVRGRWFNYKSFYPHVDENLERLRRGGSVTVWFDDDGSDQLPIFALQDAAGNMLLTYDEVVDAHESNMLFMLVVALALLVLGGVLLVLFVLNQVRGGRQKMSGDDWEPDQSYPVGY